MKKGSTRLPFGLTNCVRDILREADLEKLIRYGAPDDEYNHEADVIVRSITAGREISAAHIRDIWQVFFGSGKDDEKHTEVFEHIPMRPAFKEVAARINKLIPKREGKHVRVNR